MITIARYSKKNNFRIEVRYFKRVNLKYLLYRLRNIGQRITVIKEKDL